EVGGLRGGGRGQGQGSGQGNGQGVGSQCHVCSPACTPARQGWSGVARGRQAAKGRVEGTRATPPPRRPPRRNQSAPWPVSGLASGSRLPGAAPSRAVHSGCLERRVAAPCLAYRCGGSAGMAARGGVTGFPFQPAGTGRRVTAKPGDCSARPPPPPGARGQPCLLAFDATVPRPVACATCRGG